MTEDQLRKMYTDAGLDPEPHIADWKRLQEAKVQYEVDHAACPRCGCTAHSSTYIDNIWIVGRETEYKNPNRVQCSDCGWTGIGHDLVRADEQTGDQIRYKMGYRHGRQGLGPSCTPAAYMRGYADGRRALEEAKLRCEVQP